MQALEDVEAGEHLTLSNALSYSLNIRTFISLCRTKEFRVHVSITQYGKATDLKDLHTGKPWEFISSM